MIITTDEATHTYAIDGSPTPSATTVLRDQGMYFNPFSRDEHRLRGVLVHDGAAVVAEGDWDRDSTDPALVPYLDGYQQFLDEYRFRLHRSEVVVGSKLYRVAGRFDELGESPVLKGNGILDIKTGVPPPYTGVQLAIYKIAAEEHLGVKIDWRLTLELLGPRAPKRGKKFRLYHHTDEASDRLNAVGAISNWWFRHDHRLLGKVNLVAVADPNGDVPAELLLE